uniref:Uncharacterized protein n=1 Tax=Arundo donax TaxID=35708 RepID=A0A0A9A3R6_ARUDO
MDRIVQFVNPEIELPHDIHKLSINEKSIMLPLVRYNGL